MAVTRKAIFLDKDGTLIDDVPYNIHPERVRLTHGAGRALRRLQEAGYALIVVSNQPGVALGLFAFEALAAVEQRLRSLLATYRVELTDVLYCPHLPHSQIPDYARTCPCRKPAPGMLLEAARKHRLRLAESWLIGDILDDVEAGRRAGCRTVLIDNGNETEWRAAPLRRPHQLVTNLAEAARRILGARPGLTVYHPAEDAT